MAGATVFVAGSLHYDVVVNAPHLPRRDETVPGTGVALVCGGKGGNQAVAAARQGATTAMAGRVGDDLFGERLLAHLDAAGVDRRAVQIESGAASGMSVAIVEANGDYGAVIVSGANLAIDAGAVAVPATARVVLLQNEIPEAVNVRVACAARAAGARVMLNAAPWRELPRGLLADVDLLLLNRVEAAALAGCRDLSPATLAETIAALPAAFPDLIVTFGAAGAVYCSRARDPYHQPAFAVDVVSSHGAGDVFAGALAARLADAEPMAGALRYAAAAAALHVATPLAQRASITPAQVRIFMAPARARD